MPDPIPGFFLLRQVSGCRAGCVHAPACGVGVSTGTTRRCVRGTVEGPVVSAGSGHVLRQWLWPGPAAAFVDGAVPAAQRGVGRPGGHSPIHGRRCPELCPGQHVGTRHTHRAHGACAEHTHTARGTPRACIAHPESTHRACAAHTQHTQGTHGAPSGAALQAPGWPSGILLWPRGSSEAAAASGRTCRSLAPGGRPERTSPGSPALCRVNGEAGCTGHLRDTVAGTGPRAEGTLGTQAGPPLKPHVVCVFGGPGSSL